MKSKKFKINGEEFLIRMYKKGDEKEIIPLINHIGNMDVTLDYWNWKYKQNPAGFSILVLLNNKGKIIGQFGHLFKQGYYHGEIYPFFMGVDICIDKKYRGLGLLNRLVNEIPQFYMKKPFFNYGFPVEHILNAYKKVPKYDNYGELIKLHYMSKKYLILSNLFYGFNKNNDSLKISEASKENKGKIDDLWNKKKKELDVCVVRDWDYLNWRILTCPDKMKLFMIKNGGETVGYFSTMIKDRVCYITDILILNDFTNKNTIKQIEVFCLKHNIKEIRIFITDESIKSLFKYFKFNFYEIGQFTYFNNIEKDTRILPYFTFTDFDSV